MLLPKFFQVIENTIDNTSLDAYGNANLPVVKSSASNKGNFGGSTFLHSLLPNGGTAIVSNHIGNDDNKFYNTSSAITSGMALLYNAHGGKVTPIYSHAVTNFAEPFNFLMDFNGCKKHH